MVCAVRRESIIAHPCARVLSLFLATLNVSAWNHLLRSVLEFGTESEFQDKEEDDG